jgi:hypothetical protein
VEEARNESREEIIATFDELRRKEIIKVFPITTRVTEKTGEIEPLEEDKSKRIGSTSKEKPVIISSIDEEKKRIPAPKLDEDFELVSPSDDLKDKIRKIFGD